MSSYLRAFFRAGAITRISLGDQGGSSRANDWQLGRILCRVLARVLHWAGGYSGEFDTCVKIKLNSAVEDSESDSELKLQVEP